MTAPSNGGNCTIRGATRRRHAEGRLLMLQNPHHYPSITPGVMLPHWCRTARRASVNAGRESPAGPFCTGAGRAGRQLTPVGSRRQKRDPAARARVRRGADKHRWGVADNDERRWAASSQARLVADKALHSNGKIQPQRIRCNPSLTGAILPIRWTPPDGANPHRRRKHASPTPPLPTPPLPTPRRRRLPRRRLGPNPDQHVMFYSPPAAPQPPATARASEASTIHSHTGQGASQASTPACTY